MFWTWLWNWKMRNYSYNYSFHWHKHVTLKYELRLWVSCSVFHTCLWKYVFTAENFKSVLGNVSKRLSKNCNNASYFVLCGICMHCCWVKLERNKFPGNLEVSKTEPLTQSLLVVKATGHQTACTHKNTIEQTDRGVQANSFPQRRTSW